MKTKLSLTILLSLSLNISEKCIAAEQDFTQLLPNELYHQQGIFSNLSPVELLNTKDTDTRFQSLILEEMRARLRTQPEAPEAAFETPEQVVIYFKEIFLFNNSAEREQLNISIEKPGLLRSSEIVNSLGNVIYYAAMGSNHNLDFLINLSLHNNFEFLLNNSVRFGLAMAVQGSRHFEENCQIGKNFREHISLLIPTIDYLFTTGKVPLHSAKGRYLLALRDKFNPCRGQN